MTVHVRAPMRIDFAGGWTDVETFASSSGGIVTNAAITLYARAEFLVGGNRIRLHAQDLEQHLSLASPSEIVYDGVLDLHKAALNMLPVTGGIEILTRSDAPAGAGLGGSGALDVALLSGLAHIREEGVDGVELAELGYQLETSELHLLGGATGSIRRGPRRFSRAHLQWRWSCASPSRRFAGRRAGPRAASRPRVHGAIPFLTGHPRAGVGSLRRSHV